MKGPSSFRVRVNGYTVHLYHQTDGTLRAMVTGPHGHPGGDPCGQLDAIMDAVRLRRHRAPSCALCESGDELPAVVELTREQGREMLGERTLRMLGMSLAEFEAAYAAGSLDVGDPVVEHLEMLLPFTR
jgi:hypothetical protein